MDLRLDRRQFLTGATVLGVAATTGALAACSDGSSGGGGDAGADAASDALPTYTAFAGVTPDFQGTPDGALDGFDHYPAEPFRSIETPPGDGEPVTALTLTNGTTPDPHGSNAYWQELDARLGSPMDWTFVINPQDYNAKLATTVAGGDLPDLTFIPYGAPDTRQILTSLAADLSEHLAGAKVDAYPALANIGTDSWRAASADGVVKAIPIHRGMASSQMFLTRLDMLERAGLGATVPEVASFEEFLALSEELTNPRENIFALGDIPLMYIQGMLGIPSGWSYEGGTLTSALSYTDQQHQALEAAKQMVDAGVVHPDTIAGVEGNQPLQQLLYAGKVYLVWHNYLAWTAAYRANTGTPGFRIGALGYPGFDGGTGAPARRNPKEVRGVCMVNQESIDRIEPILGVLNYLASPFGTEEYLFKKFGRTPEEHVLNGSDPVLNADASRNLRLGQENLADGPQVTYVPEYPDDTATIFAHQQNLADIGVFDPTVGYYSQTQQRVGAEFNSTLQDVQQGVILGRNSIDEWDEVVSSWLSGDGDTIRGEFEEAMAADA